MPEPRTVPATIWECIARHTGAGGTALVTGDHHTGYGALARDVRATATALRDSGVLTGPHPRVALDLAPGPAFVTAFLGTGLAGATAMVLQRDWSDADLRHALAAGCPAVVLTDAADRPAWRSHHVGQVGDDVAGAVAALARSTMPPAVPGVARDPGVAASAPFYLGFTSGTSGRPKGFVRSHRSWVRSFDASAVFGITAGDHVLAPGPLDHSLFLYAALHGLSAGATVHLQRRFAARAVLDTLAAHPVAHVYLVPSMLATLLRAADRRGGPAFPAVRTVICSGARWPAATVARVADLFPAATPIDFYGASETSFVSLRHAAVGDPPGCVGRPFPGVEVAIRRPDGSPAAPGETGRLWVRSAQLFDGYLDPDAPGATRDTGGWLTIGDLAHIDAAGRLHLAGREAAMIVTGGVNVFPEEIEDVLLELPQVADAAVTGVPDARWGEALCALVRWHDGAVLPRRHLREHCRRRLARSKRPHRWLLAAELPRTPSGKLARDELASRLRDGTLAVEELR